MKKSGLSKADTTNNTHNINNNDESNKGSDEKPDLNIQMPFRHCRIVLSLKQEEEDDDINKDNDNNDNDINIKTGWSRDDNDNNVMVYYEVISSEEQVKLRESLKEAERSEPVSKGRKIEEWSSSWQTQMSPLSFEGTCEEIRSSTSTPSAKENFLSSTPTVTVKDCDDIQPEKESKNVEKAKASPRKPMVTVATPTPGPKPEVSQSRRTTNGNRREQRHKQMKKTSVKMMMMNKLKSKSKLVYTCPYCYEPFDEAQDMIDHLPIHDSQYSRLCRKEEELNETIKVFKGNNVTVTANSTDVNHYSDGNKQLSQEQVKTPESSDKKKGLKIQNSEKSTGVKSKDYLQIKEHFEVILRNNGKGKAYRCKLCGKIISTSCNMSRHMREVHKIGDPFDCFKCEEKFFNKDKLNYHLFTKHNLQEYEKLYKCQVCSKVLTEQPNLVRHERETHHIGTPYQCKYCTQSFWRRELLNRHLRSHKNS